MKKAETITVRVSAAEAQILDAKRGDKTRSEYIRSHIIRDNNETAILSMTANTTYLLRYLCGALGFEDLPPEAKKTADKYVQKILQE